MNQHQLLTPKKDHLPNRRSKSKSKSVPNHTKNPVGVQSKSLLPLHAENGKKGLELAVTSVSEDFLLETPRDSIDLSSISEITQDHELCESAGSRMASPNPVLLPSSETVAQFDLASLSSITAEGIDGAGQVSDGYYTVAGSKDGTDLVSMETEMVVNCLKQTRLRVMNSINADLHSQRLMAVLIDEIVEAFGDLPENKGWCFVLFSIKTRVLFLTFLTWILAVFLVFFFSFGIRNSYNEPPPT
ncbi:hypothetical protein NMG60_11024968 [Bertholletia excelsa]